MTHPLPGPVPRARRFGAPKNWREKFLACLAETSNVTAAAECAEISLSWVYKTKREDSEFAQAWLVALCEGYDNLEMELLFRLRHGEARDNPGNKYNNATALRLLLAHRETRAKFMAVQENVSAEEVRASIEAKLARLREQIQRQNEQEEDGGENR
jgi:hypothetical protein